MKRFLVGLAAAVGVLVMAVPAGAAPTNAPSSLTFPFVTCTIGSRSLLHTSFVVNGNGEGPAFSPTEGVFVAKSLTVIVNGQDTGEGYTKPGADEATYQCSGTTVTGPVDEPVVISFVATGDFHRP